jgi:hypothetical protein
MIKARMFHTWLVSLVFIMMLAAHNMDQITPAAVLWPCLVSLAGTGVVLGLVYAILKNFSRATLITSLLLVCFYSYGRIFESAWDFKRFQQMWHVHLVISFLMVLVAALLIRIIVARNSAFLELHQFITVVSILLLMFSCFKIITAVMDKPSGSKPAEIRQSHPVKTEESTALPDVYYIITDGYARLDTFKELYKFDNSPFIKELEKRGFYIPVQSYSNYAMTFLSLASSLSLNYINDIITDLGPTRKTRQPFYDIIRAPKVAEIFQAKGYRYIHFCTSYGGTEESHTADILMRQSTLLGNEFMSVLLRSTALLALAPSVADLHRFCLAEIKEIPAIQGPTFTFLHLLLPHNPYVFDKDGKERANVPLTLQFKVKTGGWEDKQAYVDQTVFLNQKLLEIVDHILAKSTVPPVILIQADHGSATTVSKKKPYPRTTERLAIFNAYYGPDHFKQALYPTISPVNSFRVLFNSLFQANYELLPEKYYFSWYQKPYVMEDVTEKIQKEISGSANVQK